MLAVLIESILNKWRTMPQAHVDLTGRTVVVTGSNTGLGLDSAKMFYEMNPARLILAVRSLEKGEAAKQSILSLHAGTASSENAPSVEVWKLDMADFSSVVQFAERCEKELERLDVFLANAGVASESWAVTKDGWEQGIQVNVLSTILLSLLVTDKMVQTSKLTAPKPGIEFVPHLVIVASDVHFFAPFSDRTQPNILVALNDQKRFNSSTRYTDTKLFEILLTRHLAQHHPVYASSNGKGPVLCTVNPGFTRSDFHRDWSPVFKWIMYSIMARPTREGAKNLIWASLGAKITSGSYVSSCKVTQPSAFVRSDEGAEAGKKLWKELVAILNGVAPQKKNAWTF